MRMGMINAAKPASRAQLLKDRRDITLHRHSLLQIEGQRVFERRVGAEPTVICLGLLTFLFDAPAELRKSPLVFFAKSAGMNRELFPRLAVFHPVVALEVEVGFFGGNNMKHDNFLPHDLELSEQFNDAVAHSEQV